MTASDSVEITSLVELIIRLLRDFDVNIIIMHLLQWHSEGADRPGRKSRGAGKNVGDSGENRGDSGKNEGYKGAPGISRLLGAAKLQSARGTNNPC